ncbi:hypothetical protein LPA44_04040 [Halobacterium sp. KA-4]|uniref:hypothetical protein n=1 Tax=Halobacterium sp. KA-4 TaxID=2896367 RepID=UPI001E2CE991|nr:hypothetical protein [Halobacterium sp. KA-4]MCD2199069.1 hypothetical protein [Halobacterium sp. KA-4]
MTDCDYCPDDLTRPLCQAEKPPYGLLCSRPEGHDGPHVACIRNTDLADGQHELAEWTDDDLEKYSDDEFTSTGVSDA